MVGVAWEVAAGALGWCPGWGAWCFRAAGRACGGDAVVAVAVGGVGLGFGAGGHGAEGGEVLLERGPGGGILFGGEREIEVGVVGEDVALDSGRDRGCGGEGEAVEEGGVGVVGKAVAGGADGIAGVEVAVGEGVAGIAGLDAGCTGGAGFGGEGSGGGRSEWVSAAAASAAVGRVEGGGVKRRRARLSSSVETMTEWM